MVCYRVLCDGVLLEVSSWDPVLPHSVESLVTLPVNVGVYKDGSGSARYRLTERTGKEGGGEEF